MSTAYDVGRQICKYVWNLWIRAQGRQVSKWNPAVNQWARFPSEIPTGHYEYIRIQKFRRMRDQRLGCRDFNRRGRRAGHLG